MTLSFRRFRRSAIAAATMALLATSVLTAAPAQAQAPHIVSVETIAPQWERISVYSVAMKRAIPLDVLRPKDRNRPAPVFYLLNGADGGSDGSSWGEQTDYAEFFADKHVNVVTPLEGKASYYSNWQHVDRNLGRNQWQTFLMKELPPVLESALGTTGKRAIAGDSMGGTAALNLATKKPGFYKAVAAYSACPGTSDPRGEAYVKLVLESRGASKVSNMWGPDGSPDWRANDPYVNASKLRGTSLFLSSATGLPGKNEQVVTPDELAVKANQAVVGGVIEAAVRQCTVDMQNRLKALHIPATFAYRAQGTHSWGYWGPELKASWPQISRALA